MDAWRGFWSTFSYRLAQELPVSALGMLRVAYSLHGAESTEKILQHLDNRAYFLGMNRVANTYAFLALLESVYAGLDVVITLRRNADALLKGGAAASNKFEVPGSAVTVTNTMVFNNNPNPPVDPVVVGYPLVASAPRITDMTMTSSSTKRRLISSLPLFTDDTYALVRVALVDAEAYEDLRVKDLPKMQVIKYVRGKERVLAAMNEEMDRDVGDGPEDAVAHEYTWIKWDNREAQVASPEARKVKNRVKQRGGAEVVAVATPLPNK